MNASSITEIEQLAKLAEKYGLAVVLLIVVTIALLYLIRLIVLGKLVPRELLERAEEDRDRLQVIMDKEREAFMRPMLQFMSNLKKDEPPIDPGGGRERVDK